MTRATFFSMIGLGAAGQQMPEPKSIAMITPGNAMPPKPRNGECPVCGTMAESFISSGFTNCHPAGWKDLQICAGPNTHRQVECARCRVVFGQDAEGEK